MVVEDDDITMDWQWQCNKRLQKMLQYLRQKGSKKDCPTTQNLPCEFFWVVAGGARVPAPYAASVARRDIVSQKAGVAPRRCSPTV